MNAGVFFNPQGRISKARFQTAALILIAIGFVLALVPTVLGGTTLMAASGIILLIQLVMAYSWVALWVKRLHQAGQTGWLTVLIVLGWGIVSMIVGSVVTMLAAPELMTMSAQSGDFMESMQRSMEASREVALPSAIASAVVAAVYVLAVNALLPSQDGDNQYGPSPA